MLVEAFRNRLKHQGGSLGQSVLGEYLAGIFAVLDCFGEHVTIRSLVKRSADLFGYLKLVSPLAVDPSSAFSLPSTHKSGRSLDTLTS